MVEIYGADWCSYCKHAVKLCEEKGVEYQYIDIDDTVNLRTLETRVGSKVRQVPQIFLNDSLVEGGFGGLQLILK